MFKESLKGRIVYLTNRYTNGIEAKKKDYRDTLVKPNIILNDKIKIINENFDKYERCLKTILDSYDNCSDVFEKGYKYYLEPFIKINNEYFYKSTPSIFISWVSFYVSRDCDENDYIIICL